MGAVIVRPDVKGAALEMLVRKRWLGGAGCSFVNTLSRTCALTTSVRCLKRVYRKGNRRGASFIEFMLLLPILLLVLAGVVDFARAYFELQMMANAATEGTRMAVYARGIGGISEASVTTRVKSFFRDGENTTVQITPGLSAPLPTTGTIVQVTVSRPFDYLLLDIFNMFGGAGALVPETLTYSAAGTIL